MNEIKIGTNRAEDEAVESAVLHQLLDLHPAQLTLEELKREMGGEREFADRDALERAVRDLAAVGLVHRGGTEFVVPTRAALRFSDLLDR